MGCDISAGRNEPCKDAVGGLKNIYLINYEDMASFTVDADDQVTAGVPVTGQPNIYKYELKGSNVLDQTVTSSRANGTTFVSQSLTVVLKKQDYTTHKQVKFLAYGRPFVLVEDYNGNYNLMGIEHGCELTTNTISSGTAMGDLNGYTINLVAEEKLPANFVTGISSDSTLQSVLDVTLVANAAQ